MALTTQTKAEIKERAIARIVAGAGLSDLRETDPMVQEVDAFASDLERVYIEQWEVRDAGLPSQCSDEDIDAHLAEVLPSGSARDSGAPAVGGAVKFYRPGADATILTILAGTPVSRKKDGFVYRTIATTTIGVDSRESGAVSIVASKPGTVGNCAASEVNRLGVSISGVTAVSNTASIDNGTDRATKDEAYQAMQAYVAGISPATKKGILSRLKAIDDATYGRVLFAKFGRLSVNQPGYITAYVDDGMGTAGPRVTIPTGEVLLSNAAGGETTLYVDNWPLVSPPVLSDGGGVLTTQPKWALPWGEAQFAAGIAAAKTITAGAYTVYSGLVAVAQRVVDGDVSNSVDYPGHRGAGDIVRVLPAALYGGVLASFGYRLWLQAGDIDRVAIEAEVARRIVAYVNSLDIGQKLYQSDVIAIARGVSGVVDVTDISLNGSTTATSLNPAENQVIRTAESRVAAL